MRFLDWKYILCGVIGAFCALIAGQLLSPPRPPQIVTVNLGSMINEYTLSLAAKKLSDPELERQLKSWSKNIQDELTAISKANNFIIIPDNAGIIGAKDITRHLFSINQGSK